MATENTISQIRADLAITSVVVNSGLPLNEYVLKGLWRWFQDVELLVPLPVMDLADAERQSLGSQILVEMDQIFASLEIQFEKATSEKEREALAVGPDGIAVNNLWREFAGVYATLINDEVTVLPDKFRKQMQANMIDQLSERYDQDPDVIRYRLKNDTQLRMMLRMAGLDPDQIS
jgi:hypothetical protein